MQKTAEKQKNHWFASIYTNEGVKLGVAAGLTAYKFYSKISKCLDEKGFAASECYITICRPNETKEVREELT